MTPNMSLSIHQYLSIHKPLFFYYEKDFSIKDFFFHPISERRKLFWGDYIKFFHEMDALCLYLLNDFDMKPSIGGPQDAEFVALRFWYL